MKNFKQFAQRIAQSLNGTLIRYTELEGFIDFENRVLIISSDSSQFQKTFSIRSKETKKPTRSSTYPKKGKIIYRKRKETQHLHEEFQAICVNELLNLCRRGTHRPRGFPRNTPPEGQACSWPSPPWRSPPRSTPWRTPPTGCPRRKSPAPLRSCPPLCRPSCQSRGPRSPWARPCTRSSAIWGCSRSCELLSGRPGHYWSAAATGGTTRRAGCPWWAWWLPLCELGAIKTRKNKLQDAIVGGIRCNSCRKNKDRGDRLWRWGGGWIRHSSLSGSPTKFLAR